MHPMCWHILSSLLRVEGILELNTTLFIGDKAGEEYLFNRNFYKKIQKNNSIAIKRLGEMKSFTSFSKDLSKRSY